MDTNYLLAREQISLMRAEQSSCSGSRHAHRGLARLYRDALTERGFPRSAAAKAA